MQGREAKMGCFFLCMPGAQQLCINFSSLKKKVILGTVVCKTVNSFNRKLIKFYAIQHPFYTGVYTFFRWCFDALSPIFQPLVNFLLKSISQFWLPLGISPSPAVFLYISSYERLFCICSSLLTTFTLILPRSIHRAENCMILSLLKTKQIFQCIYVP